MPAETNHDPIWVGEVDTARPPVSLSVSDSKPEETFVHPSMYKVARLLLRFHSEPISVILAEVDHGGEIDVDKVLKGADR